MPSSKKISSNFVGCIIQKSCTYQITPDYTLIHHSVYIVILMISRNLTGNRIQALTVTFILEHISFKPRRMNYNAMHLITIFTISDHYKVRTKKLNWQSADLLFREDLSRQRRQLSSYQRRHFTKLPINCVNLQIIETETLLCPLIQ